MILISFLPISCPRSGQLCSVFADVTCPALWIRRSLTVLYLLYSSFRLSLLVLPKFWLVLFMCSFLAFTCQFTALARSPLSLCLWLICVVMLSVVLVAVSSYSWAAPSYLDVVGSHSRFDVIWLGLVL